LECWSIFSGKSGCEKTEKKWGKKANPEVKLHSYSARKADDFFSVNETNDQLTRSAPERDASNV
jgi:hypothetical protein